MDSTQRRKVSKPHRAGFLSVRSLRSLAATPFAIPHSALRIPNSKSPLFLRKPRQIMFLRLGNAVEFRKIDGLKAPTRDKSAACKVE
jgi:hypothetical protein